MRRGEGGGKNFSVQLRCSSLDFARGSFNGSQMFSQSQQRGWKCERSCAGEGGTATAGTVIRRPGSDKLHLLTSRLTNKLALGFSLSLSLSFFLCFFCCVHTTVLNAIYEVLYIMGAKDKTACKTGSGRRFPLANQI